MGDGVVGGGGWPVGSWVIVVDIIGNGGDPAIVISHWAVVMTDGSSV